MVVSNIGQETKERDLTEGLDAANNVSSIYLWI